MSDDLLYTVIITVFGRITIVWTTLPETIVLRVLLPNYQDKLRSEYPQAIQSSSERIDDLAEDIASFLEGEDVGFNLDMVDLSLCSQFQRRVIDAEHGVPRGWVTTYGRIADHLKRPHSSRAVGRALATNPFPIVIPCHRAIKSNGALGGYQGGVKMKKQLLEMEGIEFYSSKRVMMNKVYY